MDTQSTPIDCPYCGERFELIVDPSDAGQAYIEDCFVCCRPIHLTILVGEDELGEGALQVIARDENEC